MATGSILPLNHAGAATVHVDLTQWLAWTGMLVSTVLTIACKDVYRLHMSASGQVRHKGYICFIRILVHEKCHVVRHWYCNSRMQHLKVMGY